MIRDFRCEETKAIFDGTGGGRRFRAIEGAAKRRLDILNAATSLNDLATLRSNHLEALSGDREGRHSIRINDKYRICFVWKNKDAWSVEIVDYH